MMQEFVSLDRDLDYITQEQFERYIKHLRRSETRCGIILSDWKIIGSFLGLFGTITSMIRYIHFRDSEDTLLKILGKSFDLIGKMVVIALVLKNISEATFFAHQAKILLLEVVVKQSKFMRFVAKSETGDKDIITLKKPLL
jgi:hypothetical protein